MNAISRSVGFSNRPRVDTWGARLDGEEAGLRRVLTELRANRLDAPAEADGLGDLADAGQHPAEPGLVDQFSSALEEAHAARRRLARGVYGTCERCGDTIAEARLKAVPATRWCLRCAEAVERENQWYLNNAWRRRAVLASSGVRLRWTVPLAQ